MNTVERLDKLIAWWQRNSTDLLIGCELGDGYALRFDSAIVQAVQTPSEACLEAAEIALVELEADWEGK